MGMQYKRIDRAQLIEIIPEKTPVRKLLKVLAEESYKSAAPVGLGFLQPHGIPAREMIFDAFIAMTPQEAEKNGFDSLLSVLEMDYVNGRLCKTFVVHTNGKYYFSARSYEQDRGPAEPLLDRVKEIVGREDPI
jgi:hypothetical protein